MKHWPRRKKDKFKSFGINYEVESFVVGNREFDSLVEAMRDKGANESIFVRPKGKHKDYLIQIKTTWKSE